MQTFVLDTYNAHFRRLPKPFLSGVWKSFAQSAPKNDKEMKFFAKKNFLQQNSGMVEQTFCQIKQKDSVQFLISSKSTENWIKN